MTDENIITFTEQEIAESAKRNNVTPIMKINLSDYPSFTIEEMDANPPIPKELVLSPILPRQGIGWIYASSGLGKTLFTLNLAYAMAVGGSFLKYHCVKPLKVLYVDGEMSYEQIYDRIKAIQRQQGDLDFPKNFNSLNNDLLLPRRTLKIDTPQGQFYYKKKLIDEKFDVVVFDNLSMLSSIDTNKTNEWIGIQDFLLDLRANGITVLMVHHSGKDKSGYRGTSMLMDCADVAISLQPIENTIIEDDSSGAKKFNLVYTKNRNFYGEHALPYEVQFLNGVWSHQSMRKTIMDEIRELLLLGMSQRDISTELKFSLGKTNKLIQKGRKEGLLPMKE